MPSPQVMRECSLSPSMVSTRIHGLLRGHSTYRQSLDIFTSDGREID